VDDLAAQGPTGGIRFGRTVADEQVPALSTLALNRAAERHA
jgi:hypothetical protein